jgi:5-methylcytosine-specific restriction endonuclease McrA
LKGEANSINLWSFFQKIKSDNWVKSQHDKVSNWWLMYKEYLKTDKWQNKRAKVLERDKYLCQACLVNKATQVHHLTYEEVTDEPMFDLISICSPCHEKLHKLQNNGL